MKNFKSWSALTGAFALDEKLAKFPKSYLKNIKQIKNAVAKLDSTKQAKVVAGSTGVLRISGPLETHFAIQKATPSVVAPSMKDPLVFFARWVDKVAPEGSPESAFGVSKKVAAALGASRKDCFYQRSLYARPNQKVHFVAFDQRPEFSRDAKNRKQTASERMAQPTALTIELKMVIKEGEDTRLQWSVMGGELKNNKLAQSFDKSGSLPMKTNFIVVPNVPNPSNSKTGILLIRITRKSDRELYN
mgnify:CR=1 FL=1